MPRELPSDFEIPDDAEMDDGDAEDEGQMDEDGEEEEELDYETFSRDWTSGDEEEEEIDDDEGNGWEEGLEQDPEPLDMGDDDGSQQGNTQSDVDQNVPSPSHMPFVLHPAPTPSASTHMPSTGSSAAASGAPRLSHSRRSSEDTKRLDDLIKPTSLTLSKEALQDENLALKAELKRIRAQRNQAEAHSILAHRELATLKLQNSTKASGKKRRTGIRINAELLTSAEARSRREADQAIRDAADKKKEEAKRRKAERALAEQARRLQMDAGHEFSGPLGSKKRGELEDIVKALGLLTTGTKAVLQEAIQQHFEAHPDLKSDRRFVGLFNSRRRPPAPANQNEPPQQLPHPTHPPPAQAVAGPSRSHLQTAAQRYTPYPQPHYPHVLPPRTEPLSDMPQNHYQ